MNNKYLILVVLVIINFHQITLGQSLTQIDGDTSKVYITADQMPQFPGGDRELLRYINSNVIYPRQWCDVEPIKGRVAVRFIVRKDGSITNVEIVRSLDKACDKEAVRLVESMPKWIPGKQNGETVEAYYTIPIVFKPQW